ncbi:acyltransferase family protein [Caulobacter segnis]
MVSKQLTSIQIGRGIAILMVLLVHVSAVTRSFTPSVDWTFFAFGSAGVDLFFVISGFIICIVAEKRESKSSVFLVRRFLRIYPLYAAFTVLWFIMSHAVGRGETDFIFLAKSLAIIPQEPMPYLFVGWSLEHEVIFYGMVALLLYAGRQNWLLPTLVAVWMIALLNWVGLPVLGHEPKWDYHLFSLYQIDFALGVLIYRFRHRIDFSLWPVTLTIGLAAFPIITVMLARFYPDGHLPTQGQGVAGLVRVVLFCAASTLVVASLISAETRGGLRSRIALLLGQIGNASFSLYLMHHLIFAVVAVACLRAALPSALAAPAAIVAILTAICLSLIFYRWVEKPFHDWSSGRARRRAP